MKKYKKTYAILNLAEKHTVFHLGKTRVHVSFTGGIVTKKGVTPATFTTSDPIVQVAIEHSPDFKKGAITIQAQYPMEGEVKIGKNEPEPPASEQPASVAELIKQVAAPQETAPVEEPTAESEETALAAETEESAADEEAEAPEGETPEDNPAETKNEAGLTVVEVSCKDVAKQYLQDHFDEKPAPLRTWDEVQQCAAKYGIIFTSPTIS